MQTVKQLPQEQRQRCESRTPSDGLPSSSQRFQSRKQSEHRERMHFNEQPTQRSVRLKMAQQLRVGGFVPLTTSDFQQYDLSCAGVLPRLRMALSLLP